MKTLYLECNMGAAGDMLTASLLGLFDEPSDMLRQLNSIGLPNITLDTEPVVKHGVGGTRFRVLINGSIEEGDEPSAHSGHETHGKDSGRHLHDIHAIIHNLHVSEQVKHNAKEVYGLIAEAESRVHNRSVAEVHFHEVGAMDAVADIVCFCVLIEALNPDRVLASPVSVGSGFVRCAHGLLPVPAPATALILQGIPIRSGDETGELCTPTGAALLKHFANSYIALPTMTVAKIGYGMGKKDFEHVNAVRAFWGHSDNPVEAPKQQRETVTELSCTLDDMTPEAVAFAQQLLLEEGALDVYVCPITMKKSRQGILFECICQNRDEERMAALIFKHTSTLGLRIHQAYRYTLARETHALSTPYGVVNVKESKGFGVTKTKPEYEDIAAIARQNGLSIAEALSLYACRCP